MKLQDQLLIRSENKCELCAAETDIQFYEVPHAKYNDEDGCLMICKKCLAQIDKKEELDSKHWTCLTTAMWSEVPGVQVVTWRMLNRLKEESWAADNLDMMYLDDERLAWAKATGDHENGSAVEGTNSISFRYPAGFTSGSISVTATNGCGTSGTRSLSITKFNPSTPGNIDVINTSGCPNRLYTYSIAAMPSNAVSLEWIVPNGATINSGQGSTSISVSYSSSVIDGYVRVRSINNCGISSYKSSLVRLPACPASPVASTTKGLGTIVNEAMDVKVFPNPTTSNFNLQVITADQQVVVVRILDVQGRAIKSLKVAPYQTINLGAELKAGSYLLEVKQGNSLKTTRIVKY